MKVAVLEKLLGRVPRLYELTDMRASPRICLIQTFNGDK